MNLKKLLSMLAAIAMAAALMLTGCNKAPAPTTTPSQSGVAPAASAPGTKLSGKLELSGSTSVQPLAEDLAKEFMAKNPGVKVFVQGGGCSVGVTRARDGTVDIGNVSR